MSTSSANPISTSRPGTKKGFTIPTWAYWLGVALLVLVFVGVMTLMFGRVSGEEFSPHDFKRRTFHFYELPVVGVQVWPVKRFQSTGDLETQLIKQKLITPTTPDEPRWDLVRGYRGTTLIAEGDAYILCRYLDLYDQQGAHVWLVWTNDHPKLAKVFWPVVATLAEQELYLFLPDLFQLAAVATDSDKLQEEMNSLLAQKYHDFGLVQQELGHHDAAVELLSEAVKRAPQHKSWQAELEASREALRKAAPAEGKKPA